MMIKYLIIAGCISACIICGDARGQSRRPPVKRRVTTTVQHDTAAAKKRTAQRDSAAMGRESVKATKPASVITSAGGNAAKKPAKYVTPWNPVSLSSSISSVYDSNIDRQLVDTGAYGLIVGLSGRYQSGRSHPGISATYTIAKHSYTKGDVWDRVSNDLNVVTSRAITPELTLEAIGEIALKGSSEDRDISDQYIFLPRLSYRPQASRRIRLYGAYRERKYGVTPTFNAANRYAGLELRQNIGKSGQWEAGYRFETNSARDERRSYSRRTYSTQYTTPFSMRDRAIAEMKYRRQRYDKRLVKVDGDSVPRMDHRFQPSFTLIHQFNEKAGLELSYDYEKRTSNDSRRGYRDHLFAVTSRYNW